MGPLGIWVSCGGGGGCVWVGRGLRPPGLDGIPWVARAQLGTVPSCRPDLPGRLYALLLLVPLGGQLPALTLKGLQRLPCQLWGIHPSWRSPCRGLS